MERPDGGVGRHRTAETEVGRRAWPFTQSGLSRTGEDASFLCELSFSEFGFLAFFRCFI